MGSAAARIAVVGAPGSGKSTVAAVLARQLGIPHIELDGIFHQPEWEELPASVVRLTTSAAVERFLADG